MPTPHSLTTAPHADFELEVVEGAWPDDISGEMVFSSPQHCTVDGVRHLRLGGDLPPRARTRHREARPRVGSPGSRAPSSRPASGCGTACPSSSPPSGTGYQSVLGASNASNTAPLPWGGRLYTTWDAGRPIELHPGTLEFVAEVGHRDSWGGSSLDMPGVMPFLLSSAHPVVDPDRDCLWTREARLRDRSRASGCARRWCATTAADGTQVRYWPLDGVVFGGSTHTVSQTRDWLILADSGNFKPDPAEMFGGERELTIDDEVPVWLIRKDQLEGLATGTPVTPVTPHHGAARPATSTPAGRTPTGISVVWEGMDLMDLAFYLKPDDLDVNGEPVDPAAVGLYNMAMAPETIVEVLFDPESRARPSSAASTATTGRSTCSCRRWTGRPRA